MRGGATCFLPNDAVGPNFTCPTGFLFNGDFCETTCPLAPWREAKYYRPFDLVNRILTPISLACELFVLIPWAYQGIRARNLHTKYPFFYVLCVLFVHVSMAMAWGGSMKWRCADNFTIRSQKQDGAVIFQSLLFLGGIIGANAWICCLLAHLYFRTVPEDHALLGKKGTFFGVPEWIVYHAVPQHSSLHNTDA